MLKDKGISLSPRIYFITVLSYMALGLFSSLIMGLILKTIGDGLVTRGVDASILVTIGDQAIALTGPAIGVAVAFALEAPPLILFSAVVVGAFGYEAGGPAGSYIAALIATESGKLFSKTTRLDIIVTPLLTLVIGFLSGKYIGSWIGTLMTDLGEVIRWGTEREPLLMGIFVATVMGLALTAPISSAALGIMLGLDGLAAGAATIGCAAQMIGFGVISYRDNGIGGLIAQGVGTSMLQVGNIIRNPWTIIPPTLAGALLAPFATVLFSLESNPAGSGMGTSGLVGPLMVLKTMGFTTEYYLAVGILCFVAPAIISYLIYRVLYRYGRIKDGDLKIDY
ncbi:MULTISPECIES: PTS sugar transporter subunit IIC [unclassified Exiguobacterium]|uniref:PTS transporter subunit IIC n=1 Tax=unclassified Exiguobacterium TaxID=2644629 RepID=UPI001BE5A676|nr:MULTISPECIES: PTS sugar transporter subunit IIC [unclassified Exiguobacterium]